MKAIFVAHQDPRTRHWAPVGKLTRTSDGYRFAYTKGVRDFEGFVPFGRMSLGQAYVSKELFPLFANRILPKNRPEHSEYLSWLGLSPDAHDDLEELSRTGGLRATDSLELIPCPAPQADGFYEEYFFSRGLSHAAPESRARAEGLTVGERLYLMRDVQNTRDPAALALRTADPISMVGYAPAYFAKDFSSLLANDVDEARVTVARVNPRAPAQYRVLCKFRARWPVNFSPCHDEAFQELEESDLHATSL